MKKTQKIGFKDLNIGAKVAYIGGMITAILFGFGFVLGFFSAF